MTPTRMIAPLTVFACLAATAAALEPGRPDWGDVMPILAKRCVNCHAEHGAAKGLRLDSYEGALAGSTDGPVLVSGEPAGSELVRRIRGESVPRMPFLGPPMPPEEIDLIVRWVEAGLPNSGE